MPSTDGGESRAPFVDLREQLALFLAPTLAIGFAVLVLGGRDDLVAGLVGGALFGTMLVGLRRGFYAVRTDAGIERRLKEAGGSPEGNEWIRLSQALDDIDEQYDPILAVVFGAVGLGAFAAMPSLGGDDLRLLGLLGVIGLVGTTSALITAGEVLSR